MVFFTTGFSQAFSLIVAQDQAVLAIVAVSLQVSGSATLLAGLLGVPAGFFIALRAFPGKRLLLTLLNTLLALPTVVIGLLVYGLIARRGVLGDWELLYTPQGIVIGQTFLIFPLICALTIAAVNRIDQRYRRAAMTLGASRFQVAMVIGWEARFALVAVVITAFGRVISEVGISMMLGGNIQGFTRTMTTAMALEYDQGAFALALALGMILMGLSLFLNVLFQLLQGKGSS